MIISTGLAQFDVLNIRFQGYVTPQGSLEMRTGVGQHFEGRINPQRVITGRVIGTCVYDASWQKIAYPLSLAEPIWGGSIFVASSASLCPRTNPLLVASQDCRVGLVYCLHRTPGRGHGRPFAKAVSRTILSRVGGAGCGGYAVLQPEGERFAVDFCRNLERSPPCVFDQLRSSLSRAATSLDTRCSGFGR